MKLLTIIALLLLGTSCGTIKTRAYVETRLACIERLLDQGVTATEAREVCAWAQKRGE